MDAARYQLAETSSVTASFGTGHLLRMADRPVLQGVLELELDGERFKRR